MPNTGLIMNTQPSAISSAVFNWPLTNLAIGFMQDRLAAYDLAQSLCPIVRVTGASGTYKKFDDRNSFLPEDTYRGVGGQVKRIRFQATDGTFHCVPHGLAVTVDDHEREEAGAAGQMVNGLLDQGKITSMLSRKATSYVKRVLDTVAANTTAVAGRGNWSNANIDPIDQLDEQIGLLITDVGSAKNLHIAMSPTTWITLRDHPKTKARMFAITLGLSTAQLQAMLSYPITPHIEPISITATKQGQTTVTKTQAMASELYMWSSSPNPTLYDPSPFKCFSSSDVLIEGVRTYRDEDASSDVHKIEWNEDIESTSTLSIRRLTIT